MEKSASEIDNEHTTVDVDTLTGEAEQVVHEYLGGEFCCSGTITKDNIFAYTHADGLELSSGKTIWVSAECQECGYKLSFQHWSENVKI